jgi:3'-phosphoadenosine 5'-phosphosulfate sulfotransferase (PAPS reductase)/FAD synthetase
MKILVPVSGGKDSQACLKLAIQQHGAEHVVGLFCDTRFEHPLTYAHVDKLRTLYGVRIDTINAGSVVEQCERFGRFPGGGARHCTDYLKIRPTKRYLSGLHDVEVWYGMRTGESAARNTKYGDRISEDLHPPHEIMPSKYPKYLAKQGVMFRLPILNWSSWDVFDLLGDEVNPLYAQGFDRVGCFPCLASGDKWKEKAFAHDEFGEQQKVIVMQLSKTIGKSIWTSKGGAQRNNEDQGCLICSI